MTPTTEQSAEREGTSYELVGTEIVAMRTNPRLLRPAFVVDLYGRTHYASIAGVLAFAATLAQATAPVGDGAAYDALGGSVPILWTLVVVAALASVALLPIRRDSSSSLKEERAEALPLSRS